MGTPLRTGPPAMPAMSTPTGMSSRLMTMKFMQRANAVNATNTAGASRISPTAPTPSHHGTPKYHEHGGSASKRRKTTQTAAAAHVTPPLYDEQAAEAALQEEARKRQEFMDKLAAEAGDEHWVIPPEMLPEHLRRPPPSPPYLEMSFTDMMALPSDSGHDDSTAEGGLSKLMNGSHIRRFNMGLKHKQEKGDATGEDGGSRGTSAASSDGDSDTSTSNLEEEQPIRGREAAPSRKRPHPSISTSRNKKQERTQELAAKRRKREVRLNRPGSQSVPRQALGISSGGKKFPAQQH